MVFERRRSLEPTDRHRKDIRDAFELLDTEGNGVIDGREVIVALRALGVESSRDEVKKIIAKIEKYKKNTQNSESADKIHAAIRNSNQSSLAQLDYNDFLEIMKIKLNEKPTKEQLAKGFLALANGKDVITWDDLKKASVDLGEKLSDEELREMIMHASRNKAAYVTQDDFFRLLKS